MHELPQEHSDRLRPLFAGFGHRLHGLVEAVCSPDFGRAWVDDVEQPRAAVAHCDFWFVAGNPHGAEVGRALKMIERGMVVSPGRHWDNLLQDRLGGRMGTHTRVGFATPPPDSWDRARLSSFASGLPESYSVRRVGGADVGSFAAVEKDLIANFGTPERFLERGLGFGVWQGDRCVAGCSSYTLANNKLEIEIDTHPDHRRKGLARAVAATMILHCIDNGIEPCWDAHNPESAALAEQLGFTEPTPYEVFVVGP